MNKRVLTVQDISCVGQCSLTVALPVLSACGVEAAVLPSAVLSTHTGGGFAGYTFRDLTADMPAIAQHWQKEGFHFDAVYTGYLGSGEQITHVRHIMDTLLVPGGARIVDPAMADNGKLYAGFDAAFVEKMKTLAFSADILLPNITEAALLTGMEYRKEYDEAYIEELTAALHEKGVGTVVLTGVSYEPETTGVAVSGKGFRGYYRHARLARTCHGTGDLFASAFTGLLCRGYEPFPAAEAAAEFVLACIRRTEPEHWYGVRFEPVLYRLAAKAAGIDLPAAAIDLSE